MTILLGRVVLADARGGGVGNGASIGIDTVPGGNCIGSMLPPYMPTPGHTPAACDDTIAPATSMLLDVAGALLCTRGRWLTGGGTVCLFVAGLVFLCLSLALREDADTVVVTAPATASVATLAAATSATASLVRSPALALTTQAFDTRGIAGVPVGCESAGRSPGKMRESNVDGMPNVLVLLAAPGVERGPTPAACACGWLGMNGKAPKSFM